MDNFSSITQAQKKERNYLFPIFLKLNELQTLIIGGMYVGFEKLNAVLSNSPDARVTLVAIQISEDVKSLASNHPNVKLFERPFLETDLKDIDLVIIGTSDKQLNKEIRQVCKSHKILTNVADTPELCDFYLSSVVQKGNMKIAISTNGKSPTVAKRIKEVLNDSFPEELDLVLDKLSKIRETLKGDFADKVKQLNGITSVLVEPSKKPFFKRTIVLVMVSIIVSLLFLILGFVIGKGY